MSQEPNKTDNQAQFRTLTNAELDGVCGGISPAFMLGVAVGYYWDLPVGTTKDDAAAALGVSHLLK